MGCSSAGPIRDAVSKCPMGTRGEMTRSRETTAASRGGGRGQDLDYKGMKWSPHGRQAPFRNNITSWLLTLKSPSAELGSSSLLANTAPNRNTYTPRIPLTPSPDSCSISSYKIDSLFVFYQGRRKFPPTFSPRTGPCAGSPKARLYCLTAAMLGRGPQRSERFAQGRVGIEPIETPCQPGVVYAPPLLLASA